MNWGDWAAGECGFCLANPPLKDVAEFSRGFVVQAQMRVLFHDIESVAEFGCHIRVHCGVHSSILDHRLQVYRFSSGFQAEISLIQKDFL